VLTSLSHCTEVLRLATVRNLARAHKALAWVQERTWRLLHGQATLVVQGMRLSAPKPKLRGKNSR
jgi:hypothetical protein